MGGMMQGLMKFNRGLMRQSTAVMGWVGWLMMVNLIVPLFLLEHLEARVVLATFAVSGLLMGWITGQFGFTRLLGHILWIPLLWWLSGRVGLHPQSAWVGLWLRVLMVTNGVSLLIDIIDVGRYAAGDREEAAGLS